MRWGPIFRDFRVRVLALVLLGFIPAAISVAYSGLRLRQEALSTARSELRALAGSLATEYAKAFYNARDLLSAISKLDALVSMDPARAKPVLTELAGEFPQFTGLILVDAKGRLVTSSYPMERRFDLSQSTLLQLASKRRTFVTGESVIGVLSGKPIITCAQPLFDRQRNLRGFVGAGLDLAQLSFTLAGKYLGGRQAFFLAVDTLDNRVVGHFPDPLKHIGKPIADPKMLSTLNSRKRSGSFAGSCLDLKEGLFVFQRTWVPYGGRDMFISAGIPKRVALAQASAYADRNLLALGAGFLFLFLGAWLCAVRFVIRPVVRLRRSVELMGAGNLDVRVGPPYGRDAIGALAKAFDAMATSLREQESQRNRAEQSLRQLNRHLRLLSATNRALVRAQDEQQLLEEACRLIVEEGGYPFAWIGYAADDDEKAVRPVAHYGQASSYLEGLEITWDEKRERGRGPTGTAIRTGKTQVARNVQTEATFAPWREAALEHGFGSSLCLPLTITGRSIGGLNIYAARRDAFDREELALLTELADDLSFGIASLRERARREKAEAELAASEERYRTLLESSPTGVVLCDLEGKIIYINPALVAMSGWRPEDCLGRKLLSFVPEDQQRAAREALGEMLAGNVVSGLETLAINKKGEAAQVRASGSPVRDEEGRIVGCVLTIEDITRQKLLEAQLLQAQKLEAVGTMAGGIAHDFNNLLQAILGYADLALLDKAADDPDYPVLQEIRAAGHRGADLVRQLLTISRKVEPQKAPVHLNEVVENTIKLLRRTIPRMIEIDVQLADELPVIEVDAGQLGQVIMNLALNAKDAMGDHGKLTVATEAVELDTAFVERFPGARPGRYLRLRVSDTGCGMHRETMAHMFEPFYTTKDRTRGTGLGLSTSLSIVENHGGFITCDSEPGKGSTFFVYLPAKPAEQVEAPVPAEDAGLPRGSETILVTDDDHAVSKLARDILERHGYKVVAAATGEEALEIYRRHGQDIDLILLDLIMPGMGGTECLKRLKQLDPKVKVLIASGFNAGAATADKSLQAALGMVRKPYDLEALLRQVRACLDQR